MNIEALKANLRELSKKVYALRYADNAISDEELRARIARITEVREKANIHAAWSRHRQYGSFSCNGREARVILNCDLSIM